MGSKKIKSSLLTLLLFTALASPWINPVKGENSPKPPEPPLPPDEKTAIEKIIDKKAGFIVEKNSIKVIKPKFAKKKKVKTVKKRVKLANLKTQKKVTQRKKNAIKNVNGKRQMYVEATAYSSTVLQCDSSPFVTASGTRVHSGTIAANFLPFGTRIKIPDYFGNKIFVVEDRMAYSNRIDIWMPSYREAIQFGRKNVRIVVLD